MKKLCALLRVKKKFQQDDTKIINFDEGVLILCPFFWGNVIFQICHFCLKSHYWLPKCFHYLASPGKDLFALALKIENSMNKEMAKHSLLNFAVLQSGGAILKEISPYPNRDFWYKRSKFWNYIASEITRKIRLRAVDWYASALSHTALLPKSLI